MDFVSEIAVHGYVDDRTSPSLLRKTYSRYPEKPILMTEKCFGVGAVSAHKGIQFGSWERAENLTIEMIQNFNKDVVGYLYWNFILDHLGGPNYANNYIDPPIVADESYSSIYKQPMFYALAHFSKFILVGSRRIEAAQCGQDTSLIHAIAYDCPDGSTVVILYNRSDNQTIVNVLDDHVGNMQLTIKPKSINTLIYPSKY